MMSELRAAYRALRAAPLVTPVSILSLALGIGANTAIFSIVDSLLLRALPVDRPDRLAVAVPNMPGFTTWTNPQWEQIAARRHELFQTAFAFAPARFNLAPGGETDVVEGLWVSGDYFAALGVPPILGRTIAAADDRRGGGSSGPVAVVSYAFWQRRFGGSMDVIGKSLTIERVPFTIVGVMPPRFFGVNVGTTFDVAVPIGAEPVIRGRDSALDRGSRWWLRVLVRLNDRQTMASGEQALRGIQPRIREATAPADAAPEIKAKYLAPPFGLQSAATGISAMRTRYRTPLLAIMAVVALVLLIACGNIANLLLARATARRHEFSVRRAVGASRWRLARQLLVESAMLSGAGGLIGLSIARWGSPLLVRQLSTPASPVFLDGTLDSRVLLFTAAVAIATAVLFGVAPAVRAARAQPMDALRECGRGSVAAGRIGFGNLLVVAQVALSLVLVVAAGLFLRTFASLATLDLGFDRNPILLARLNAQRSGVDPSERGALFDRVLQSVRAAPGVARAALSEVTPVSGALSDLAVDIKDGPRLTLPQNVCYRNTVSPGWFAAYGTRVVKGRDFNDRDSSEAVPVVIVNERFVRKFIPAGDPIGLHVRNAYPPANEPAAWWEIVGVAADAAYVSIRDEVPPTIYLPLAQQRQHPASLSVSVRAVNGSPALLVRGVAAAIGRVDGDITATFTPLKTQLDATLMQERLVAVLSGFFGALALLLAGLGLYGVTTYVVNRRRREIGIRMALGAAAQDVVSMVLIRVALFVGAGVMTGVVVSLWASRYGAALLYGVTPHDTPTLIVAALVLAAVGGFAGWIPARRAAHLDPAHVLRDE